VGVYLLLGDIHLADKPPSSCTNTYLEDLFELLAQTVDLARRLDTAGVIWAGDVFDRKVPSQTSHRTVRLAVGIARTYHCPLYVVPGNHDLSHDRITSVWEGQPLGVLIGSGAAHYLNGWSWDEEATGDRVYGVPWLQRFDDQTVSDALDEWRTCLKPGLPGLVVAHAPLYPPGQELPYEFYPTAAWAKAMGNHGSVYYGHVHDPHGTYEVDGVQFCNPGALSRGSLHEHNLNRPVQVVTWDSDTGQFTIHTLPHKPAEQVFRLAEVREEKEARINLDAFLASVGETTLDVMSIEAVLARLREMLPDTDEYRLAEDLLEVTA
jgi:DNA repair exonuclease SbcCD nuclease subunit